MSKKKKRILIIGVVVLIIVVGGIVVYNYESPKTLGNNQVQNEKSPSFSPQLPPPNTPVPIFKIDNIPVRREHAGGKHGELNSIEEKTVIECLASQTNIDKTKSHFDGFRGGFDMGPAVKEITKDSDHAFYLFTNQGKFFVKVNNFSDLARFEYEKESMLAINEAVPDLAPRPLCLGNLPQGGKFLVVSFMEGPGHDRLLVENQKLLAKSLAQLHQKKSPNGKFGFHIGKNNQGKDNGAMFFLENRGQPLGERVLKKYPQDEELKKGGDIIGEKVIPELLGNLPVEPVLIHGNLIFDVGDTNPQTKQTGLFDTYSYYGHNEVDLSLIHYRAQDLNGPLGKVPEGQEGEFYEPEFLAEYQKNHSLLPGFEKRRDLYRLYDGLFRNIARGGHPNKKFPQKVLIKMKKLGQKYN